MTILPVSERQVRECYGCFFFDSDNYWCNLHNTDAEWLRDKCQHEDHKAPLELCEFNFTQKELSDFIKHHNQQEQA